MSGLPKRSAKQKGKGEDNLQMPFLLIHCISLFYYLHNITCCIQSRLIHPSSHNNDDNQKRDKKCKLMNDDVLIQTQPHT